MLYSLNSNREAVTIKRKNRHHNSTNISEVLLNLPSSSVMTMIGLLTFPPPFEVDANTVMLYLVNLLSPVRVVSFAEAFTTLVCSLPLGSAV